VLGVRSPFVRAEEEVVRCAEAFSEGGRGSSPRLQYVHYERKEPAILSSK